MSQRWCLCAALSVLLTRGPALAHPQFTGQTVNRYTKLVLLPRGQVRLIYTIMVGDGPAFALRRQADRDGDGRLAQAEGAALAGELMALAGRGLALSVDGKPTALRFTEPTLGLAGDAVAPAAFSVDSFATLTLPPGRVHELRYDDRTALPPVGEVEILVEEGPGVQLLESCQGPPRPGQPAKISAFRFNGPPLSSLADRSVTVRFIEPQAVVPSRRSPWLAGLVASGMLLGGVALVAWRRAKSRRRPGTGQSA